MASKDKVDLTTQRENLVKLRSEIQFAICETGSLHASAGEGTSERSEEESSLKLGRVGDFGALDSTMSEAESGAATQRELRKTQGELRKIKNKYKESKRENVKLAKEKNKMSDMLVAIKEKIAQAENVFKSVSEEFNLEKDVLEKQLIGEKQKVAIFKTQENKLKDECKRKIESVKSGIVKELKEMKEIHQVTLQEKDEMTKLLASSSTELESIQVRLKTLQKEYGEKINKVSRENTELKKELNLVKNEKLSAVRSKTLLEKSINLIKSKQTKVVSDFILLREQTHKDMAKVKDLLSKGNREINEVKTLTTSGANELEKTRKQLHRQIQEEERLKISLEEAKRALQDSLKDKHEMEVNNLKQTRETDKMKKKLNQILAKKTKLEEDFDKFKIDSEKQITKLKSYQSHVSTKSENASSGAKYKPSLHTPSCQPFPVRASTPVEGVGDVDNFDTLDHKTKVLREVYNILLDRYNDLRKHHRQCNDVENTENFALDTINSEMSIFVGRSKHHPMEANDLGDMEEKVTDLEGENQELRKRLETQAESVVKVQQEFQLKVTDFQKLLETITRAKDNIEKAMLKQRDIYEKKLEKLREDLSVDGAPSTTDAALRQIKSAENQIGELTDRLRMGEEEKNLQKLKIDHLTRECKLFERHVADLEAQISAQQTQIQEATKEHTESIKMLAEMRLEQELQRHDQQSEFSRITEELQQLRPATANPQDNADDTNALLSAPATGIPDQAADNSSAVSASSSHTDVVDDARVLSNIGPDRDGHKALEIKHFKMVEELAQLERELKETKDKYERELTILKEAFHQEKQKVRTLQAKARETSADAGPENDSMEQRSEPGADQTQFISELLGVREKLSVLQKASCTLKSENQSLKDNMKKQEEVVKRIQDDMDSTHGTSSMVSKVTGQQISLLQEERDELWEKLNTMTEQDEEIAEMLEQKYKLEQKAQQEREMWRQKCQEKELLEIQLLQERMERERQIRDITQLQELIRQREALGQERDRMTTNSTGTGQPDSKAKAKESVLARERARLGIAIGKQLSKPIAIVSAPPNKNTFLPIHNAIGAFNRPETGITTTGCGVRLGCGCVSEVGSSHMRAKCSYHQAIERLRCEMRPGGDIPIEVNRRGRSVTRKKRN